MTKKSRQCPPWATPHSEPIAQSEPGPGHNLIGVSAVDYVSKITVLGTIAIKIYFLRKTFDGIL